MIGAVTSGLLNIEASAISAPAALFCRGELIESIDHRVIRIFRSAL